MKTTSASHFLYLQLQYVNSGYTSTQKATRVHRSMELVSVQYHFEYTARDGRLVSIEPNESFILVSKTNEHWWQVRKDQHTKPFYVPAQYVKQLSSPTQDSAGPNKMDSPECVTNRKADTTPVIRLSAQFSPRETCRFSTFGLCVDLSDVREKMTHSLENTKTHGSTSTSAPLNTDSLQLYAKPHPVPKVRNREESKSSPPDGKIDQPQTSLHPDDMDFPPPPDSPVYDVIPELQVQQFDTFPELPAPDACDETSAVETLNEEAEAASSSDALSVEQVNVFMLVF